MFHNKKILTLAFFPLLILSCTFSEYPKIKNIYPKKPFVGTPISINGKGFCSSENIKLYINNVIVEKDSVDIIDWQDDHIEIILPVVDDTFEIKIINNDKSHTKKFHSKKTSTFQYFNPTKYTMKYRVKVENIENRSVKKGKLLIYIPQPILSDELISKNIISIDPAPTYIQDNGVLIYEIDPSIEKNFYLEEMLEFVTQYKKINLDNTPDNLQYIPNSPLYELYTKEEPPLIIPNDEVIQKRLKRIIKENDTTLTKIKKIHKWVTKRMQHKYPIEDRSPLFSIQTGRGDCLSDAYLFATLIRAAGIPIRLNSGYIFYHKWMVVGGHFWEEVFVPGFGWIPIDVSFSHSPGFLFIQKYSTSPDFYFGGNDCKRMAFCKGRIKIMKPDENGKLTFYKYLSSFQSPILIPSDEEVKITYDFKKRTLLEDITPLYDTSSDWFNK